MNAKIVAMNGRIALLHVVKTIYEKRMARYREDIGIIPTKEILSPLIYVNNIFVKDYYALPTAEELGGIIENFKAHGRKRICFKVRKPNAYIKRPVGIIRSDSYAYDLYYFDVDLLMGIING